MKKDKCILGLMALVLCVSCGGKNVDKTEDADTLAVENLDTLTEVDIPLQLKAEYPSIDNKSWSYKAEIKNGKVEVSYNLEEVKRLFMNIGEAQWRIGSSTLSSVVETKADEVKSVFIGDIGQDYRPVLCMLMGDKTVEILDLFHAVTAYDFKTCGALRGFNGIKGFDELKDSDCAGSEGADHLGIVAINGKGVRKEITIYHGPNMITYDYEENDNSYQRLIELTPDWKIAYELSFAGEVLVTRYNGVFWVENFDEVKDETYFGYNFDEMEEPGDEPYTAKSSEIKKKGIFKMSGINCGDDESYDITPMKGFDFGGTMGEKVRYNAFNLFG